MGDLIADIYERRMTHSERMKEFANENKLVLTVFFMLLLIIAVTSLHSLFLISPKNGQSNEGYGYQNPGNKGVNKLVDVHEDIIKVGSGVANDLQKPITLKRAQDHPGLNSPIQ